MEKNQFQNKNLFKLEKSGRLLEQCQNKVLGLFVNSHAHAHIHILTQTYIYQHIHSCTLLFPHGNEHSRDLPVPPSSHGGKSAPKLHSGLTGAREGVWERQSWLQRVICTISRSGGQLNPSLGLPVSLLPEQGGAQLGAASTLPAPTRVHGPIDPFPTVPAPRRVSPGVSPAPRGSRGRGRAHRATAPAFGQRLLTHVGYRSRNRPASVPECQSGLSFDQRYNQIQHSSMDY